MKSLELANGKVINIKSFEISGDNYGWDRWYVDENNECHHSITCESELSDAMELGRLINDMLDKLPNVERVKFEFTVNV